MNKLMMMTSCVALASVFAGCATSNGSASTSFFSGSTTKTSMEKTTAPVVDVKTTVASSTDKCDLTVYPQTTGPIDSYRPKFEVANKKVTLTGTGKTEKEATDQAILLGCIKENCDYIAAAKKVVRTLTSSKNGTVYETTIIGFPASIVGIETIKTKFYEKGVDGTMKEIGNPENRYVYDVKDGKWLVNMLPVDLEVKGGDVKNCSIAPEAKPAPAGKTAQSPAALPQVEIPFSSLKF